MASPEYHRDKQATISQCILMGLLMVLFNIGFWMDEWSTDGTVVNEVSQICFDKYGEHCCQTYEDLKRQTPDWVGHQRRTVIAAYIGVAITFILTGVALFYEWTWIVFIILILATCLSVISTFAAMALFSVNFGNIPGFQHQKLGASFWLFLVCFFLQVLIPVLVFIEWTRTLPDQCKRLWKENIIDSLDINLQFTSTHYKVKENEELVIETSVQQPKTCRSVKWRRRYDGMRLEDINPDQEQRYRVGHFPQPSLTITKVTPKDNCEFQCIIEKCDRWIYESDFIQVEVLYKPKITKLVSRRTKQSLTLTCSVDANPTVLRRVRWVKTNGTNEDIVKEDRDLDIAATHSLTYKKSNLNSNDSGDYKCKAENGVAWGVSGSVSVSVKEEPDTESTVQAKDCQVAIVPTEDK